MKVRFYHWCNAVLAALLGMLGFSGCDEIGRDEYGTPWSDYQVKGVVTDEAGQPIPGIRVEVAEHIENVQEDGERHVYYHGLDTLQTDAQGEYKSRVLTAHEGAPYTVKIIVKDTDGPENGGEFQSDTLSVSDLERKQLKKGDEGWYAGRYEYTGNATLKLKGEN